VRSDLNKPWCMINPFLMATSPRRALAATILLILTAIAIYAPGFKAPFVFDDLPNITENVYIRMTEITPPALITILKSPSASRPLANLSFAINFFFHHYEVGGYHAVNLIIHIINALLIWLVFRHTLSLCEITDDRIAFFAAALWTVSPLHAESVTYIVQRMNSLATLFYLAALLCYIQARRPVAGGRVKPRLFYGACLTAALLGLAAKEIVAILPITLLVYEWCFFQRLNRSWLIRRLPWSGLAVLGIVLLAFVYTGGTLPDKLRDMYAHQTFTPAQRLLTEPAVVVYYISLLLFPHPARLTLDYDFPVSQALTQPPATVLAMFALIMSVLAAIRLARRHRLLSFVILWFLVNLIIESSVLGLYLIFEHRTYLPSIFPALGLVWLVFFFSPSKPLASILLTLIIGVFGFWTYQRNTVWTDAVTFWRDAVNKAPGKSRPYSNLGTALLTRGEAQPGLAVLNQGLKQNPFDTDILNAMAIAYHLTGDDEMALAHCRKALAIEPGHIEAANTMGFVLRQQYRLEEAETYFQRVLATAPDNFEAAMNMGLLEQARGSTVKALAWFEKAVRLHPACGRAFYHLGVCLARDDQNDQARRFLETALKLDDTDHRCHEALAGVLLKQGATDAAMAHYERALAIAPADVNARTGLARALLQNGRSQDALSQIDHAITQSPRDLVLRWQITRLLVESGHLAEAAGHMDWLLTAHPDQPKLLYNLACLYALQGETAKAADCLKKAVEKGYDDWHHLRNDPDLKNIHDTDYFKQLTR